MNYSFDNPSLMPQSVDSAQNIRFCFNMLIWENIELVQPQKPVTIAFKFYLPANVIIKVFLRKIIKRQNPLSV
jgi:hypothetical protein